MRISLPDTTTATEIDPGAVYIPEIAKASGAFAKAVYSNSKLPLRTFEAARIVTAVINGCKICMNWRAARDVSQFGIENGVDTNGEAPDEEFYFALLDNDFKGLSRQEELAIQYATMMGTDPQKLSADDALWNEMRTEFSEAELTDLTYCVAMWIGLGRMTHVLGIDSGCEVTSQS
jgi:alkylhydroperoxidase family enzyme